MGGLRVFSSWKFKAGQTRNEISIAVKDLIIGAIDETKWDAKAEEAEHDKKQYEGKFSELFPMCRFTFVNAKRAIEDPSQQDPYARGNSHVEDLYSLFQSRRGKHERQKLLKSDVERACNDLLVLLRKPLQAAGFPNVPWHKAVLANFLHEAAKEDLKIPIFS